MNEKEREKALAAYTLSDEISDIRIDFERAETVLQEIVDSYFLAFDRATERGKFAILWEFDRHSIYSEIVQEYMFKMRQVLDNLAEISREGSRIRPPEIKEPQEIEAPAELEKAC